MSSATWKYRAGDQELGPLTTEELCQGFATGKVPLDTSVYCAAVGRWVKAATIPGFRSAAAMAPTHASAPRTPTFTGTAFSNPVVEDDVADGDAEGSEGGFFRGAARFSAGVPAAIITLGFLLRAAGTEWKQLVPPVVSLVLGLLVIAAFLAGIVALFGLGTARDPRGLRVPAFSGIIFNGIVILGGVAGITMGRTAQAQFVNDSDKSLLEYPGWTGAAKMSEGLVVVASFDDDSPAARHVNEKLNGQYSVLDIGIDNRHGSQALEINPSAVLVRTQGGNIRAMDLQKVLQASDPQTRRWAEMQVARPGQFIQFPCLIPRGSDLRGGYEVDVMVNGGQMSLPGRFMSAEERRSYYEAGKRLKQEGRF